jgi:phosphosulfolactate synthase (CoM biosynthesis protein A)
MVSPRFVDRITRKRGRKYLYDVADQFRARVVEHVVYKGHIRKLGINVKLFVDHSQIVQLSYSRSGI